LSYVGKGKTPEWLKRDFILGFFGKKLTNAQKGYRDFVSKLIGQEYETPNRVGPSKLIVIMMKRR
jgi:hypothetical protein